MRVSKPEVKADAAWHGRQRGCTRIAEVLGKVRRGLRWVRMLKAQRKADCGFSMAWKAGGFTTRLIRMDREEGG